MKSVGLALLAIILALVGTQTAAADPSGVPDPFYSYAVCAFPGPGTATVMNLPDGSGKAFDAAQTAAGAVVDATITVTVLDGFENPIQGFPFEDIWFESSDGGVAFCPGGNTADAVTDHAGQTFFRYPNFAGRYSEALCQIFITGSPLIQNGLPVSFNSPDISGNLVVDLEDLGYFASDYFGVYHFRSDFSRDGILNLSDLGAFARSYQARCP